MKVLVLGAGGQVGSELAKELVESLSFDEGEDRLTLAKRSDVDVTDGRALKDFIYFQEPNWIINATAYTSVDNAETDIVQAYKVNEHAVKVLADFCVANDSKLIHISTDYVFDGSGVSPFNESCKVAPLGVYGSSKLAGEESVRATMQDYIILRTSWVFGASGNNFVKTMLRLAKTRGELGVVGDQFGAPTSARGIAKTITSVVSTMSTAGSSDKRWGTYHYSGQPFVSWAEFANEIFMQAEDLGLINSVPRINPILTSEYPTPAARPANSRLDCSKLQHAFGIKPDDWKSSLGLMLEELKVGMLN